MFMANSNINLLTPKYWKPVEKQQSYRKKQTTNKFETENWFLPCYSLKLNGF